ncbi:MAG: acyl-CoA synthetase [Acidobacteria bacterium]|nr:acyl-CoA synthetase [Acidobacteriota bacterium]
MTPTTATADTLTPLLNPRSIAIIGASDDATRIGGRPLAYTREAGFVGPIFPVNPKRTTVQGLPAFPTIGDVPEPVDAAIIAVPGPTVVHTAEQCAAAGVKAAIVFSAGFAEMNAGGKAAQDNLTALARSSGMRIVGPNCLGVYNPAEHFFGTFTSTFEAGRPEPGRVALVTQSGAYGSHLSLLATLRGIGIRYMVTTGNECDVDVAETIGWLAMQPEVSVIVAYAEGVRDRERLFTSLRTAHEQRVPVIFQKVGKTKVGALAAQSHTASLAGADAVYDGVFRQYGVHRARDTEEMLDIAYAASFGILPASRRVGLMSVSGGVGVQMADEAIERGLEVTPMSEAAQSRLKEILPFASPRNPVDITAQAFNDLSLVRTNIETMQDEGIYDSIVGFFTFVAAAQAMAEPIAQTLEAARKRAPDTFMVLSIVGPPELVKRYEEAGYPVFEDPSRAVRVVAALAQFHEALERPMPTTNATASGASLPEAPISEANARTLLEQAGLPLAPARLCATADETVDAADSFGYPVALKIVSPQIAHKTEVGGIELGIANAAGARRAFASITGRVRLTCPEAQIDGMLVSPMVDGGVEAILGVQHDPTFGPVIMFGLGGIFVEVIKDVTFRVAPIDEVEAERMIAELRGAPLLAGVRGRPPCDIPALAKALAALSRFAAAHGDTLESAELNPVVVRPNGEGLAALDALVVPKATKD